MRVIQKCIFVPKWNVAFVMTCVSSKVHRLLQNKTGCFCVWSYKNKLYYNNWMLIIFISLVYERLIMHYILRIKTLHVKCASLNTLHSNKITKRSIYFLKALTVCSFWEFTQNTLRSRILHPNEFLKRIIQFLIDMLIIFNFMSIKWTNRIIRNMIIPQWHPPRPKKKTHFFKITIIFNFLKIDALLNVLFFSLFGMIDYNLKNEKVSTSFETTWGFKYQHLTISSGDIS